MDSETVRATDKKQVSGSGGSQWLPATHIHWTRRQSPEWKPRRASVAACQLQYNNNNNNQLLASTTTCNIRRDSLTTTDNHWTTTDSSSVTLRKFLSQRLAFRSNNLEAQSSMNSKSCKKSNKDDKSSSSCGSSRRSSAYLLPATAASATSTTTTDCSGQQVSGQLTAADVTLSSVADWPLNRSSSSALHEQQQQHQQQPLEVATCCQQGGAKIAANSNNNSNHHLQLVLTGMNEKLELQDKQRKFLILSMALKRMASAQSLSVAQQTSTTECRSKSCANFNRSPSVTRGATASRTSNHQLHLRERKQQQQQRKHSTRSVSATTDKQLELRCAQESQLNTQQPQPPSERKMSSSTTAQQQQQQESHCCTVKRRHLSFCNCCISPTLPPPVSSTSWRRRQHQRSVSQHDQQQPPVEEQAAARTHNATSNSSYCTSPRSSSSQLTDYDYDMNIQQQSHRKQQQQQHQQQHQQVDTDTEDEDDETPAQAQPPVAHSPGPDLEALIVESWLDDNPHFVHDYFMRKASSQLIDDWLIAHAANVSNTNLSLSPSPPVVVVGEPEEQQHRLQVAVHRHQQQQHHFLSAKSDHHLRTSGASTPVRKISATDFESRSGSGFLRPMVSTTPDGRPTFLARTGDSAGDDDEEGEEETGRMSGGEQLSGSTATQRDVDRVEQRDATVAASGTGDGAQVAPRVQTTDEMKLIFELVKNICNDLDIRTLLHKILRNIAVLINADKSSLFLVCGQPGDPNRHLVSQLFNVDQDSQELASGCQLSNNSGNSNEQQQETPVIKIPWGTGLVGYVAESGEALNIANCYEDPRFTDTIDQRTGYVTKHMLCAPILDKRNEIVGVAQVINKRNGEAFSAEDEERFKRYLQFCGIGLRNAQSYEHCQLENRRNQVLLDLARMVFEEQSTIEQVVYRIMLHTQSLLDCQRCQVLLIDDGSDELDQLLQLPGACAQATSSSSSSQVSHTAQVSVVEQKADQVAAEQRKPPEWRPQCCNIVTGVAVAAAAAAEVEKGAVEKRATPTQVLDQPSELSTTTLHTNEQSLSSTQKLQSSSSKLFSLVFDLESEDSDLVVVHNNAADSNLSSSSAERKLTTGGRKRRQFPINIGITGYVAMTGETLNIEDAHKCDRFDKSVDENFDDELDDKAADEKIEKSNDLKKSSGNFKHKSILCMPIRNGQRQIIGVIQLINKKNGRPFNKNDEDLFEAFAIFCGLGIHNTLMYERVLKIMAKQRVTFEVLSYHATAPLEEARKLNEQQIPSCLTLNLTSLKFNDFSLDEQFMLKACLRFFLDLDLMRRFQIDRLVFCNWILSVQKNYRKVTYHPIVGGSGLKASPVCYHNWRHAFNVSQMMFAILINTQICQTLGELETLALLIACLCHDLDHRGTNNSFQIKSASPLAELYSTSTMEHHHFDQCVMILNSQGNQILANLSPDEYKRVIMLLKEAILATDLANYFARRELFFKLCNSSQLNWQHNQEHRSLLRCMLMTACDVAAITKPWSVQKVVADLVRSEFYQQGDLEKEEFNIEPIDMMNRDKMSKLPEMQIGFIDSICAPIYTAFARLFPRELQPLLDGCIVNRDLWMEVAKQEQSGCSAGEGEVAGEEVTGNQEGEIITNASEAMPKLNAFSSPQFDHLFLCDDLKLDEHNQQLKLSDCSLITTCSPSPTSITSSGDSSSEHNHSPFEQNQLPFNQQQPRQQQLPKQRKSL